MALQTFTAGQVLTAAQVNALQADHYNQTVSTKTASYVLVAADKGTRVVMNSASATTITVNTSVFAAGDTLFIQNIGAGVCTITAGTATVSSVASLALAANAGGTLYFTSAGVAIFFPNYGAASALTLVKTQTIGSAVSSVTVTNAFSATYDNYKITVGDASASSASVDIRLSFNGTLSFYQGNLITYTYSGAPGGTVTSTPDKNQASFRSVSASIAVPSTGMDLDVEIKKPFLTKFTSVSSHYADGSKSGIYVGHYNDNLSVTDFTLTPSSGTLTGGIIRVYGYANS